MTCDDFNLILHVTLNSLYFLKLVTVDKLKHDYMLSRETFIIIPFIPRAPYSAILKHVPC